ncbi:MAG: hypothetical protein ACREI7_10045 [Myxococcota bacterium]
MGRNSTPASPAPSRHRESVAATSRLVPSPASAGWPRKGITSQITPELREFVAAKFGSPEQVDVFLHLYRHADKEWTAAQVAAALGMAPQSAGMRLFLLSSTGLLAVSGGAEAVYRYQREPALDLLSDLLERAHAAARDELVDILSGESRPDPARQFADAVRLRKP